MLKEINPEYKSLFLSEAKEYIQILNSSLLVLEKDPMQYEQINEMFRSAHTLKGMASTMGYENIFELSHQLEDVLEILKNKRSFNIKFINTLFECVDILNSYIEEVETGKKSKMNSSAIMKKMKNFVIKSKSIKTGLQEKKQDKDNGEGRGHSPRRHRDPRRKHRVTPRTSHI